MPSNTERVRAAYLSSGLTYDELAELTQVKRNSLACWITGRRTPNDSITAMIEEKVTSYINGGSEYINKTAYADDFTKTVYEICSETAPEKIAQEVMKAFHKLPTTSINILRRK